MLEKYFKDISDCDVLVRSFWLAQLPQKNELGIHVFNQNGQNQNPNPNKSPEMVNIINISNIYLIKLFIIINFFKSRSVKAKIKKYKSQIDRLKEKIRSQNVDIEEALKRLTVPIFLLFFYLIKKKLFFFLK